MRCALFRNETWRADRAAQLYLFRTEGFSLTKLFTRLDCNVIQHCNTRLSITGSYVMGGKKAIDVQH